MSIEVKIAKIADISLYLAMLSIVQDRGFMQYTSMSHDCRDQPSVLLHENGLLVAKMGNK